MLLSAVSVLVVAQSSSEIPEGLMNNPVLFYPIFPDLRNNTAFWKVPRLGPFIPLVRATCK